MIGIEAAVRDDAEHADQDGLEPCLGPQPTLKTIRHRAHNEAVSRPWEALKVTSATNQSLLESCRANSSLPKEIWETGSLGSPVLALRGGHPDVLKYVANHYEKQFRKGWRDLRAGLAVFMAPLMHHEVGSRGMEELVLALCEAQSLPVVSIASTTLTSDEHGESRKGDPDESFYIGEKAEAFLSMERREGSDATVDAFKDVPADLAVEIEHTHYDAAKRTIYQEAGVTELWEMATTRSGKTPTIIDLQAPQGPRAAEESLLIAGVQASRLNDARKTLQDIGGYRGFLKEHTLGRPVAKRLLDTAGASSHLAAPSQS